VLIDFTHEAFHEDDLREADRETTEVARERVHVVEVVQLHCVGEIKRELFYVWASAK